MIHFRVDQLNPSLLDQNYLERWGRVRKLNQIFAQTLPMLKSSHAQIRLIDLGGGQAPYRQLVQSFPILWFSTDIKDSLPVQVVLDGQKLPIESNSIDIVLCTQVLELIPDIFSCMDEIYRVLHTGGIAILSAPAVFPPYGNARWRIMPDGWKQLTQQFTEVTVDAEVNTVASFFRVTNLYIAILLHSVPLVRDLWRITFCPLFNLIGKWAIPRFHDIGFACNYIVVVRK